MQVSVLGIDLGKNSCSVVGLDGSGKVVVQAAAVSAVFNLLNSAAALAGVWATMPALPAALPWWLLAVGAGGFLGSWLGVRHLPPAALRFILAALLFAAGTRMILA